MMTNGMMTNEGMTNGMQRGMNRYRQTETDRHFVSMVYILHKQTQRNRHKHRDKHRETDIQNTNTQREKQNRG